MSKAFKRFAYQCSACALLGALVTVSIAWAVAYWGPGTSTNPWVVTPCNIADPRVYKDGGWTVFHIEMRGRTLLEARTNGGLFLEPTTLPAWSTLESYCTAYPIGRSPTSWSIDPLLASERAFGWPCLALSFRCGAHLGGQAITPELIRWGVQLTPRGPINKQKSFDNVYLERVLPLRVLPSGFAINSLLVACATWLVAFGPRTGRRWLRRRRHACLHCGYSLALAPSTQCPECGKAPE